jgi:hypothetical protein
MLLTILFSLLLSLMTTKSCSCEGTILLEGAPSKLGIILPIFAAPIILYAAYRGVVNYNTVEVVDRGPSPIIDSGVESLYDTATSPIEGKSAVD